MAYPLVAYSPNYDFGEDPAPQDLVNATALMTEFSAISTWASGLTYTLGQVIRDDNTLVDSLVRIRNLHPELWDYIKSQLEGNLTTYALTWRTPVRAASSTNVSSLVGLQTIDGVSLLAGDTILLLGQADTRQNGPWVVAAVGQSGNPSGLWTRPSDWASASAMTGGWAVVVREGTANANSAWAPLISTAGAGFVDTTGVSFYAVQGPFPIPVTKGGTGATTAVQAAANLGVPRKQVYTVVGNGATATFFVNHTLNTRDVQVQVRQTASPYEYTEVTVRANSTGQLELTFAFNVPNAESYTVIVVG